VTKHVAAVVLLCAAFALVAPAALAQQSPAAPLTDNEERDYTPHKETKEQLAKLAESAEEQVRGFADYVNEQFAAATDAKLFGGGALAVAAAIGVVSLFFGWTLVQSLLVPCAPVVGLATGGVMAFSIVRTFYEESSSGLRIALLAVGCLVGLAAYLFSAMRAKPIAALLVVMSPFIILASFLFPYNATAGLVLFIAGFIGGFMAMLSVRPLCILGTSLLGGVLLVTAMGLLAHLGNDDEGTVRQAWDWFVNNPLNLAVLLCVVSFLGLSFQFSTGPRGTLQG
jgi:hypothetical protein